MMKLYNKRKRAFEILQENLSESMAGHIKKYPMLRDWIVDAMIEFGDEISPKQKNWFEKLPLHYRYIIYFACGILLGGAIIY